MADYLLLLSQLWNIITSSHESSRPPFKGASTKNIIDLRQRDRKCFIANLELLPISIYEGKVLGFLLEEQKLPNVLSPGALRPINIFWCLSPLSKPSQFLLGANFKLFMVYVQS